MEKKSKIKKSDGRHKKIKRKLKPTQMNVERENYFLLDPNWMGFWEEDQGH